MIKIKHSLYQEDLHYMSKYIQSYWNTGKRKKILIIGATGLIGSCLIDALLYYNNHINNQFDIYAMGRSMTRLEKRFSYALPSNIHLYEHNIILPLRMDDDFDYIFQLASNADPGKYAMYPLETITTNILGSINVINYAKEHLHSRILFTSSMEVYGENEGGYLTETDYGAIDFNCIRSGYPESKRNAELLYRSAAEEYGVLGCIARLGYIYGPTMTDSDNKVVAQFIRSAISGEDILLKSEGTQRRTYCYVGDVVTGMIALIASGKVGEAYNIADKKSLITIRQLGEMISEEFGLNFVIKPDLDKSGEITNKMNRILGTDKLENLGWTARYTIKNGIVRTIEILKESGLQE